MSDPTRKYEIEHCVLCDCRFPTTMQVVDSANLVCEKCTDLVSGTVPESFELEDSIDTITTKLAIADAAIEMFQGNLALQTIIGEGDARQHMLNRAKHKVARELMYELCEKLDKETTNDQR